MGMGLEDKQKETKWLRASKRKEYTQKRNGFRPCAFKLGDNKAIDTKMQKINKKSNSRKLNSKNSKSLTTTTTTTTETTKNTQTDGTIDALIIECIL